MKTFEEIVNGNYIESEWLDYKMKIDFKDNKVDLLRDILSFANNDYEDAQYIIYGIAEDEKKRPVLKGLNHLSFSDNSEYQALVGQHIEPYISIFFTLHQINNKSFLMLTIRADKSKRPYLVKKQYNKNTEKHKKPVIREGEAWIREDSFKRLMKRDDYEAIYRNRVYPIEVLLRDRLLFIRDQDPGKLSITINNYSDIDRLFTNVKLVIEDDFGTELGMTYMVMFQTGSHLQKYSDDSDFTLTIPRKSEIEGVGMFGFTSTQAKRVGLNPDGRSEKNYTFKLLFEYHEGNIYEYPFDGCSIIAKGAVLWKIIKNAKETGRKK